MSNEELDEKAREEIATHAINMTEIAMGMAAVSQSLATTHRTAAQKAEAATREYEQARRRIGEEMSRHLRAIEAFVGAHRAVIVKVPT